MVAIREDFVLQRQEGAAGVDEVDAGQPVLERDLLRAQMLLHRDGIIGAALDRRVIRDDQVFVSVDPADARHETGGRRVVAIHAARGQRGDLEERAARIEECLDAVAWQELAARDVLLARALAAARRGERLPPPEFGDE